MVKKNTALASNEANGSSSDEKPIKKVMQVRPLNTMTLSVQIVGTEIYVQNRFSQKMREKMKATQIAGSTSKKGSKKEPKDFEQLYEGAYYRSEDGHYGIPAPAFRSALIDACRGAGFTMTHAKCSLFIEADGRDAADQTSLVYFTKGKPVYKEDTVRNDSGVADIRPRAMWMPGWEAVVRIRFDADQFTQDDVLSLLYRAGQTIGVGEGRPFSKDSNGMGWGLFALVSDERAKRRSAS
jgi:hypothetical protein